MSGDDERDLIDAIVDAVDECAPRPGDVLVFLPGEREIRESAEALRKHHPVGTEVLLLYARLSQAEQQQIFHPRGNARGAGHQRGRDLADRAGHPLRGRQRPGAGQALFLAQQGRAAARVEPVSRASANQRAGRCGRVGPGVCIRLYDELDFNARAPFTDPEVLRSSLASVILRMKALKLDDIEQFPFVEAPPGRAVADGYHLLRELGAIEQSAADDGAEAASGASFTLTRSGQELAKLPVDPRIGRMILAARDQQCLAEMLIIASALSVQDPRDRHAGARGGRGRSRSPTTSRSSFLPETVALVRRAGAARAAQAGGAAAPELPVADPAARVARRAYPAVGAGGRAGLARQQTEATFEQLHAGAAVGPAGQYRLQSDEGGHYQGAREIRFHIHPGSRLVKRGAGGRGRAGGNHPAVRALRARIEPTWLERVAEHLLRKNWSDPRWEEGRAGGRQRARHAVRPDHLYRPAHPLRPGQPSHARELFIRQALVPGEIDTRLAFVAHNRKLIAGIEKLEHQTRRPDILVDDELIYAFYDRQLPADISQTATLEKWVSGLDKPPPPSSCDARDELMRHEAAGVTTEVFPKKVEWQGCMALALPFRAGLAARWRDAVGAVFALNQLDPARCEWLVPGMLEKVHLLLKSLPQKLRRHCVLPDYAAGFYERWFERLAEPPSGLVDAVIADMWDQVQVRPAQADFKLERCRRTCS